MFTPWSMPNKNTPSDFESGNSYVLMPFEDTKPTGLIVDIAETSIKSLGEGWGGGVGGGGREDPHQSKS